MTCRTNGTYLSAFTSSTAMSKFITSEALKQSLNVTQQLFIIMNMNICRTCLKTPADTHLSELEKCLNEDNKNYLDVMLFCLDIKVTEDSKTTTKLCTNCYRKIISFYKFKVLSLKNDAYLKSLDSGVQLPDQKLTVYVDENGLKHENYLDSDDFGPSLIEDCNTEIKVEVNVKVEDKVDVKIESDNEDTHNVESDEEPLSVVQKVKKKYEDIREQTKVKAPKRKKFSHPKKTLKKSTEKHEAQICEECGKTFRNLKEHLLQHQPETKRRKVQCQACPKLFLNKGDRHRHYKTVHLGLKKKCSICNKEVTRLSVHMARHDPATLRFACVERAPLRVANRAGRPRDLAHEQL